MKNYNWKRLAIIVLLSLIAVAVMLYIVLPATNAIGMRLGDAVIATTEKYPIGVLITFGVLGFIAYCLKRQETIIIDGDDEDRPTMADYFKILDTIRPAVAEVASVLGLAPIDSTTDMAANGAERILKWGRVWGLKYKALKQKSASIDVDLARRVIQEQVATVLDRDNPSKLTEINFNHYGHFVPCIQIDEIKDDDAYVFIYVVMASKTYFAQKEQEARKRVSTLHTETNTDDTDF